MKKISASAIFCLIGFMASAQFIYKIKADSVLITNDSCNAELIIQNSTKNVCGFLFNKGNGRTEFRSALIKLNDSTYVVGCDTLHLHSGSGGGNITAANGLTNSSGTIKLGGALEEITTINLDNQFLKFDDGVPEEGTGHGYFRLYSPAYSGMDGIHVAMSSYANVLGGVGSTFTLNNEAIDLKCENGSISSQIDIGYAGLGISSPHFFHTNLDTSIFESTIVSGVPQLRSFGTIRAGGLSTGGTAPSTTGTTKMVITDANGLLSFANIPSGGGSGISTLNTLTGSTQSFATGTSGTDFNISSSGTTHTFNIPDASTSARGLVTTGNQNFSGIKTFTGSVNANAGLSVTGSTAFIQQVLQITNPNAGIVIGASADYRKTNAGGGIHPELGSAIAAVTAGTLSYSIDRNNGNGFVFCAANGTRQISRASINITNLNNTAGSESGDLIFLTQSGGTAMNEKFRIGSNGLLTASSYASGTFYQNDTASYKPVVIDGSGNIFQSSWLGNSPGGGSGYSTVQEGGTALTQRSNLNFGYGVTAIDNSGSTRTDVNLDVANSESFLTSDVTLTANTYSDAVSFSLAAGTWMIAGNATVESPNNTAQRVTYKLWDGTTVYQAGEAACNSMGANTKGYVSVPVSGLIVLTGTTTIKISVASTAASLIKATPGDNSSGTTNKATSFRAVRIK